MLGLCDRGRGIILARLQERFEISTVYSYRFARDVPQLAAKSPALNRFLRTSHDLGDLALKQETLAWRNPINVCSRIICLSHSNLRKGMPQRRTTI
jgi:hypothetical protein